MHLILTEDGITIERVDNHWQRINQLPRIVFEANVKPNWKQFEPDTQELNLQRIRRALQTKVTRHSWNSVAQAVNAVVKYTNILHKFAFLSYS